MTSFWCFSINGFRAWFAEVDVFFCMKPFYSTNHVLSVQGSATASLHLPYSSCSSNQRASTNSVAALPRCVLCGHRFSSPCLSLSLGCDFVPHDFSKASR